MRTDRYRFTQWRVPGTDFLAEELYDHERDPGENVNRADDPEYGEQVERLRARLAAGWPGALRTAIQAAPDAR
jgi:hypothetical protein